MYRAQATRHLDAAAAAVLRVCLGLALLSQHKQVFMANVFKLMCQERYYSGSVFGSLSPQQHLSQCESLQIFSLLARLKETPRSTHESGSQHSSISNWQSLHPAPRFTPLAICRGVARISTTPAPLMPGRRSTGTRAERRAPTPAPHPATHPPTRPPCV